MTLRVEVVTIASIATAMSLAQAYISKNTSMSEDVKKRPQISPPSESSALPTVQEGDESAAALQASSPRPMMGPSVVNNSTTPKQSRSQQKPSTSLFKSVQTLLSILNEPGVLEKTSRLPSTALSFSLMLSIFSRSAGELFAQKISSQIDEALLTQNRVNFPKLLSQFVLLGIPVAVVQQLAHLSAGNLSAKVRQSLISALMDRLVMCSHNLRHPEELVDSERVEALMGDISTVSSLGVQLLSERIRRITEIVMQVRFLVRTVGFKVPIILLLFLALAVRVTAKQKFFKALFLKRVVEREQVLKKALSRLQRHRDDVALWDGATVEKEAVMRLVDRIESARTVREGFDFIHSLSSVLSSKLGGTALGLSLIAPVFLNENRPLFQYLLTARVLFQLTGSLSGLLEEEFLMALPKPQGVTAEETNPNVAAMTRLAVSVRRLKASIVDLPKQLPASDSLPFKVRKSNLCLNDVTGMSTEGNVLFQSLSLELQPGNALLVKGPKGSGKSALLRMMAGTWPAVMGDVSRPRTGVICVPQKPYLLLEGSLKDQVCYPDSGEGIDNERLQAAIKATNIGHLFTVNGVARSGSGSALMGDTDQAKLMLARLLHHRPKYALLDDCWRHLDLEYLASMLKLLKEQNCGIVLATTDASALQSPAFPFKFDIELTLNNSKQPPRHEILIHRQQV